VTARRGRLNALACLSLLLTLPACQSESPTGAPDAAVPSGSSGSSGSSGPEQASPAEALRPDGSDPEALSRHVDALLFGSDTPCRDGSECPAGQCLFGQCAGLARSDEPWRAELVLDRIAVAVARAPAVGPPLVSHLAALVASDDVSLATRARFIRALERLAAREALSALARGAAGTGGRPLPPQLAVALSLARLRAGDAEALPAVLGLLDQDPDTSIALRPVITVEAIRALGAAAAFPPAARTSAASALLTELTGDVPQTHARAALDALRALSWPPTWRALLAWAPNAPASLRDATFIALEAMTGASHGRDLAAWQRWCDANAVPPALAFTPRTRSAEEDIGLPDP
jgi:hypothetical protein